MAKAPSPKTKSATSKSQNVHVIAGTDESGVKRAALQLADELVPPEVGEFGREIIDGGADNVDQAVTRIHQAIESVLTLPFFGGSKLVWLKNVNFLGDNVMGRSASVLEALEKLHDVLASGLPDGVRFLMSATEVDKRRTFYKNLSKLADVQVFDKPDLSRSGWEEEAGRLIEQRASERQLRFRGEALDLFTQLTGGDPRHIENELEKLDLYLDTKRRDITTEDVRLLVPLSRAGVVFELGNAIAQRDLRRCLALIDQLLTQGESAIGILLVAIVPTVRNLLLAKDLMQRHRLSPPQQPHFFISTLNRLPTEATSHLPRKKDGTINAYALGIAASNAKRYTTDELLGLFHACLRANVQVVTSQSDQRVVLAELVARLAPGKEGIRKP